MITGEDRINFLKMEVRRLRDQVALLTEQIDDYRELFEELMELEQFEDDSDEIVLTEREQEMVDALKHAEDVAPMAKAFNRQKTTSDLIRRARDEHESVIRGVQARLDDEAERDALPETNIIVSDAKKQQLIEQAALIRNGVTKE